MPASWATALSPSRSGIAPEGLATISVWMALVFGRIAAANASTSPAPMNVVATPKRPSVTSNKVRVPP